MDVSPVFHAPAGVAIRVFVPRPRAGASPDLQGGPFVSSGQRKRQGDHSHGVVERPCADYDLYAARGGGRLGAGPVGTGGGSAPCDHRLLRRVRIHALVHAPAQAPPPRTFLAFSPAQWPPPPAPPLHAPELQRGVPARRPPVRHTATALQTALCPGPRARRSRR